MDKIKYFFWLIFFVWPAVVSAQAVQRDCGTVPGLPIPSPFCGFGGFGFGAPAGQTEVSYLIISILNILLAFAGLLAVLFIIIGGIQYISARGNEEAAEGAKKTLLRAVIGLAVVILSFVIVRVISDALARP